MIAQGGKTDKDRLASFEQIINLSSQRKDAQLINDIHILYPIKELNQPVEGRFVSLETNCHEASESSNL